MKLVQLRYHTISGPIFEWLKTRWPTIQKMDINVRFSNGWTSLDHFIKKISFEQKRLGKCTIRKPDRK
jgi:hypothetical protein